jgi:hypothetical protein
MNKPENSLVSIITINYNNADVTQHLLESIGYSSYKNIEVIVVDNGSKDDSVASLKRNNPSLTLIESAENLGFAGGNNLGLMHASGDHLFFVNNDTVLTPDLVMLLVLELEKNAQVGAVSPKIRYHAQPKIIQYVGSTKMNRLTMRNRHIGHGELDYGQHDSQKVTSFAHGAAMMVKRSVIDKVGVMCQEFFLYYEELDWCERIRSEGYIIHVVPNALIYHKESMSTGKKSPLKTYYMARSRFLFARRNTQGIECLLPLLFLTFCSWPQNIIRLFFKRTHLAAYNSALLWNFSRGKYTYKPF